MEELKETLLPSDMNTTSSLFEGFEPQGDKEKNYYIRGKFATIETVNNNKRFYPRALWEREVLKYQDEIKNGTINTLMEWDHPEDRLEVDPAHAIGKITKLWIDGNYVMGEAVIFDTPKAEVLKSMIKHGVQISVSSRASGKVDSAGVVQEFNLITFDFVAKPSDKSATMYGLYEKYLDATNESSGNVVYANSQYINIPEPYKFLTVNIDGSIQAHKSDPKYDKGYWKSKDDALDVGIVHFDEDKLKSVLTNDETSKDLKTREAENCKLKLTGSVNLAKVFGAPWNAYGMYYAIKNFNLNEEINKMNEETNTKAVETDEPVLESLVRQIRTKDSIIDDLKEEMRILKESNMNEANDFYTFNVDFESEKIEIPKTYKFITCDWDGISVHKEKPRYDLNNMEFKSKSKVKIVHLYWDPETILTDYDETIDPEDLEDDGVDRHWETLVDWANENIKKKGLHTLKDKMVASKLTGVYDGYCDDGELDYEFDISMLNESRSNRSSRSNRILARGGKPIQLRLMEGYSRRSGSNRQRLMEGDILNTVLDGRRDFYRDYGYHKDEEDMEYFLRRPGERLTQTHRHQDHTLLRDTDPASTTYSGESEILRIAQLLQQVIGRDNVVGSRLDKDIDTGLTVRGYAAGIEEEPRFAENGLDIIQKTLTESYPTRPRRASRLLEALED